MTQLTSAISAATKSAATTTPATTRWTGFSSLTSRSRSLPLRTPKNDQTTASSVRTSDAVPHPGRRKASPLRTLLAVVWSFFGVRKSKDLERDVSELNPLHLVVAGVVVAALFVGALIALVNWVIKSGVAA